MTDNFNDFGPATDLSSHKWADVQSRKIPARKFHLENLVAKNELVCFSSAPGIDTLPFAIILAFSIAEGKTLGPFKASRRANVTLWLGSHDYDADIIRMHDVARVFGDSEDPICSAATLEVHHSGFQKTSPVSFNQRSGQSHMLNSLGKHCNVLIIPDANFWFPPWNKRDQYDPRRPNPLLEELKNREITVILLQELDRRNPLPSILGCKRSNLVHLEYDAAAPIDQGGGFNLTRSKYHPNDSIPPTIQFWWMKLDNELKFGFEHRNPDDIKTPKQIAMALRKKQIQDLVALDWTQKEIAVELGLHPSAVNRSLAQTSEPLEFNQLADWATSPPSRGDKLEDSLDMATTDDLVNPRRIGRVPILNSDADGPTDQEREEMAAEEDRLDLMHELGVSDDADNLDATDPQPKLPNATESFAHVRKPESGYIVLKKPPSD